MSLTHTSSSSSSASVAEASAILKRLTERLHQYNTCEQQADIDSLQTILDSPLFRTLFNLQESIQQLKNEYEKGNQLVRNCLFDFDLHGRLHFIQQSHSNSTNERHWPSKAHRSASISPPFPN